MITDEPDDFAWRRALGSRDSGHRDPLVQAARHEWLCLLELCDWVSAVEPNRKASWRGA